MKRRCWRFGEIAKFYTDDYGFVSWIYNGNSYCDRRYHASTDLVFVICALHVGVLCLIEGLNEIRYCSAKLEIIE